ncbi:MAG: ribonuclease R [Hyphomicrobiaceae bacterium]|nr:ribonuclease R [Hyphomicrobiaceae bacterium]
MNRPAPGPRVTVKRPAEGELPTREDILAFVRTAQGQVGKREISRAFGIKGGDRLALKKLLQEMADDGQLAGNRKALRQKGFLPPVGAFDIVGRDSDGDLIAEPVQWNIDDGERPKAVLRESRAQRGRADVVIGVGDRVLAKTQRLDDEDYAYSIQPMKKLPNEKTRALGVYRANSSGGGGRLEPVDRKEMRSWIIDAGNEGEAKNGDLVRFDLVRSGRFGIPAAKVVDVLGNPDDQRQISLIAVHAHGIPDEFPPTVIDELEQLPRLTMAGRIDLRSMPLVTIDPVDARDHDDAVLAIPDDSADNPGGHIVWVAIADVAHYVVSGSRLDREARLRGNSVYFPDRVVPMLPEKISNDLCSLRELEDRPCLALEMVFDAQGHKRGHTFHRAMMRSHAKLSYQEAQAAIDGRSSDKAAGVLEGSLKPLWAAYKVLSKARDHRGPLDLNLPERKILLDASGRVERVFVPERLEAHRLIEEFMIQANVAAAETLEQNKVPLVYRVHEPPSAEKLRALADFLSSLDMVLPKAGQLKPSHFNEILTRAKGLPVADLVNEVVLRSQSQAVYARENLGHFGLFLRRYAHFTSPIRRYADLIVHRALIRALKFGKDGLVDKDIDDLGEIAMMISQAERRAMLAERETTDRLIAAFLSDKVGLEFDARVSGVTRSGLFVRLKESGADGFIPISTLGDEYFHHDEVHHALVGEKSRRGYRLGDQVRVKLVEAVPMAGALRFEMQSEPKSGHSAPGGGARGPKRQLGRSRSDGGRGRGRR